MGGTVKIAYWDTAQGNPPRLVGQIRGTPTIKFIAPSKKNKKNSNKKKTVSDYNGERKAEAMLSFASSMMPNFVTKINDGQKGMEKFLAKADKYALPTILTVTKSPGGLDPVTKALSTEFRRRALVAEIKLTKKNIALIESFGIDDWISDSSHKVKTAVLSRKEDGTFVAMRKNSEIAKFSFSRAKAFMKKFALEKPYYEDEKAQAKLSARESGREEL